METVDCPPLPLKPRRRVFALGLGTRLLGALLIWLGDGSPAWWRKGVVLLGILLFVGGVAVLKYLLYSGMRRKPARP